MLDGRRRWLPLILAALVVSCSEDPTEQNALLAPLPYVEVAVRETTITATGGSSYRQFLPMDGAINLVGRSGNYTATTAIAFYSNLFPARDTVSVLSATLYLRAASFFGDSTAPFSFTVHPILRSWTQGMTNWDSVQTGFYDAGTVSGSFTGGVGPDSQRIAVTLDTALVRKWLATAGTANANDKWGIVLVPTAGTNVVRGFSSFESDSIKDYPTLEVIAVNTAQTVRDTSTFFYGIDTFVGNNEGLNSRTDLLYLQAGIVYRSALRFDLGFIPKGATVNLAEFVLERDPSTSLLNRFSGEGAFNAHILVEDSVKGIFEPVATSGALKSGTQNTYTADARRAAQSWIRGPNYGVVVRIKGEQEFTSFDLVTFHSPTAVNAALRPRLRILYSVPKN